MAYLVGKAYTLLIILNFEPYVAYDGKQWISDYKQRDFWGGVQTGEIVYGRSETSFTGKILYRFVAQVDLRDKAGAETNIPNSIYC
jgi:hypothetical protein